MISQDAVNLNLTEQSGLRSKAEDMGTPAKPATGKTGGKRFNAILDAAEDIFAASGFSGASMREIAEKAGVAQALIHYHFSTKERLIEELVVKRGGEINNLRQQRLKALFKKSSVPQLEDVTDVLLRPTIEIGHRAGNSSNGFARILVSAANSSDRLSTKLTKQYYDPIARQFITAFEKATPGLSHENAVWAYMFSIGVGMTMMAQTGRSQRLSGGLCDDTDVEAMLARIIPFIAAGIRAVVDVKDPPVSNQYQKNPEREK